MSSGAADQDGAGGALRRLTRDRPPRDRASTGTGEGRHRPRPRRVRSDTETITGIQLLTA